MKTLAQVVALSLGALIRVHAEEVPLVDRGAILVAWSDMTSLARRVEAQSLSNLLSKSAIKLSESRAVTSEMVAKRSKDDPERTVALKLLELSSEKSEELEDSDFAKKLFQAILRDFLTYYSGMEAESWSRDRGSVTLHLGSDSGKRVSISFVQESDTWVLSDSTTVSLLHWWVCKTRVHSLLLELWNFESKQREYPESIDCLSRDGTRVTSSPLNCCSSQLPFVYMYPLEGLSAPASRIILYDPQSGPEGYRLVASFGGTISWVTSSRFDSWLNTERATIRSSLEKWKASASSARDSTRWRMGLENLEKSLGQK